MQLAVDRALLLAPVGIIEEREYGESDKSAAGFKENIPSAPSVRHETLQIKLEDHAKNLARWLAVIGVRGKDTAFSHGLATMGQTKLISGVLLLGFFDVSYGERN